MVGVSSMADGASIGGYGSVGRTADFASEAMERSRGAASRRSRLEEGLPASTASTVRGTDRVEVSAMALYVSKLQQMPAIREDLVARVRAQIAAGGYDSEDRLNAAMDEMMKDARI